MLFRSCITWESLRFSANFTEQTLIYITWFFSLVWFQLWILIARSLYVTVVRVFSPVRRSKAFPHRLLTPASLSVNLKHSQQTKSHPFLTEAFGFFADVQYLAFLSTSSAWQETVCLSVWKQNEPLHFCVWRPCLLLFWNWLSFTHRREIIPSVC